MILPAMTILRSPIRLLLKVKQIDTEVTVDRNQRISQTCTSGNSTELLYPSSVMKAGRLLNTIRTKIIKWQKSAHFSRIFCTAL